MSSQTEMYERMTEERLLALLVAIQWKYSCRYFTSARHVKLEDNYNGIIWEKDFLLAKSRQEVKVIITSALARFKRREA